MYRMRIGSYFRESRLFAWIALMLCRLHNFHLHRDNPAEKIFMGRIAVENASAYTYFNKQSVMQNLLHQLKYKGKKEIGLYFGRRMGEAFEASERYKADRCP